MDPFAAPPPPGEERKRGGGGGDPFGDLDLGSLYSGGGGGGGGGGAPSANGASLQPDPSVPPGQTGGALPGGDPFGSLMGGGMAAQARPPPAQQPPQQQPQQQQQQQQQQQWQVDGGGAQYVSPHQHPPYQPHPPPSSPPPPQQSQPQPQLQQPQPQPQQQPQPQPQPQQQYPPSQHPQPPLSPVPPPLEYDPWDMGSMRNAVPTSPPMSPVPPPPQQQPNNDPYGIAAGAAMVPSSHPNVDPFGVRGGGAGAAPPRSDPFGAPPAPGAPAPGAVVPISAPPPPDPFGIFASHQAPAQAPTAREPAPARVSARPPDGALAPVAVHAPPPPRGAPQASPAGDGGGGGGDDDDDDDFWSTMGFADTSRAPAPAPAPAPARSESEPAGGGGDDSGGDARPSPPPPSGGSGRGQERGRGGGVRDGASPETTAAPPEDVEVTVDPTTGLPMGGETYAARIASQSLGVIFFSPPELKSSVFCRVSDSNLEALGERAAVGHAFDQGAASAAGITVGHVLLRVNGREVGSPRDARDAVRDGKRPLQLEFFVPPADAYPIGVEGGMHMVKYDTPDEVAPDSPWEWKPKYVVVGGVIARPWMMMMYRSKAEYDHAIKSVMSGGTPTVKVKQFSLLGARIFLDERGPLRVNPPYPKKPHMRYVSVIPKRGYPIKISARTEEDLRPVHEGIRRVIRAQRAGAYDDMLPTRTFRDEYGRGGRRGGGGGGGGGGGDGRDEYAEDDERPAQWAYPER